MYSNVFNNVISPMDYYALPWLVIDVVFEVPRQGMETRVYVAHAFYCSLRLVQNVCSTCQEGVPCILQIVQ
jgi:hypothetical protein